MNAERLGPAWVLWMPLEEASAGWGELSERERLLCGAIRHPDRARQFWAGRCVVRRLWSWLGGRDSIEVLADADGRPVLVCAGDALQEWTLSIAHTKGLVVAALRRGGSVGVDVEADRPVPLELMRRIADEAEAAIARRWAPEAPALAVWVLKEAGLKALGSGLRRSPRKLRLLEEAGALFLHGYGVRLKALLRRLPDRFWLALSWD
ncbi:MAG: 4'-phosphopantetheinyl transferase superfamily protein [Bacteroidetes bacterium]|nr:4'-phosphopantetheinyl transferase superfamily protein [Rhodothermia bacterium]MCS7155554.1 4'-phosphopantetheinyl transferase superfamily protein [Bacteroidota bacterium]MCX7906412.1 4'-phosphopantetheinyl transferase superfamily protein [Bacteroidota bacterium]MDW8137306.1 4'-phosphopantetheinyl transferase superfamily protein [Bacteroidota bacterium]MDW8284824.1 4'-phosphopantetheinyl transferase superfamily protein [Bacteroidota bacterium]